MIPTALGTELGTSARSRTRARRDTEGRPSRRILITGGAGFLGVNAAVHMIDGGWHVTLLDNLSRPGTERNLKWLITQYPTHSTFIKEDVGMQPP
jgi:CDP-paratose 2-epimerase